jgi:hypothetical protein
VAQQKRGGSARPIPNQAKEIEQKQTDNTLIMMGQPHGMTR